MSERVQNYATPQPRAPLPRPNLEPRPALFWTALGLFTAWFAVLVWIYLRQHA